MRLQVMHFAAHLKMPRMQCKNVCSRDTDQTFKSEMEEARISVRIGIHSGEAEWGINKYMGYITLARTARVMSSAYRRSDHHFKVYL
ncbi:MAG: hypothetical protein R3A12_10280 [Ignavibacteria bacterium]